MYSCSDVAKSIASDEYLNAGPLKKLGVRVHLLMCKHCSRYLRQLQILAAQVREAPDPIPSSSFEHIKSRILNNLSVGP